jgi:hypothetical protein
LIWKKDAVNLSVERTFAWLGARRRLLVRWEKKLANFVGFTLVGCLSLLLQRLAQTQL